SGPGGLFTTVSDTLANRAFALALPVPLIVGLEELVDGTLLEYLGRRRWTAAVFEGGQHEEPEAVERHEAALWMALAKAGVIEADEPRVHEARARLAEAARGLPPALEMRYRHPVSPGDGFRMLPGFRNFQPVRRGEVLAEDRNGPVRAPESGLVLMPLYQEQGQDGFFLVRPFTTFWLGVSRLLRLLRVQNVVHWLPGVRRHPTLPGALVVNRRVARWFALELLHLLGYRRHLDEGDRLVVIRRPGGL
ncbi:MAG: aspartoacylase, partial [Gemmatimonadetes bacterium]